jgi:hypothetical protein
MPSAQLGIRSDATKSLRSTSSVIAMYLLQTFLKRSARYFSGLSKSAIEDGAECNMTHFYLVGQVATFGQLVRSSGQTAKAVSLDAYVV